MPTSLFFFFFVAVFFSSSLMSVEEFSSLSMLVVVVSSSTIAVVVGSVSYALYRTFLQSTVVNLSLLVVWCCQPNHHPVPLDKVFDVDLIPK